MSGTGSSTILPAVEQRIGSSSQPLEGAGFDPAFIPGLTSPVSGEAEDAGPGDAGPEEAVEEADADEPTPTAEEPDDAGEEEAPDGPVFEASDRRAKFVADHQGVRLSLDDQACEFRWDEIGAIETETPRFGKRFTITVHTPTAAGTRSRSRRSRGRGSPTGTSSWTRSWTSTSRTKPRRRRKRGPRSPTRDS